VEDERLQMAPCEPFEEVMSAYARSLRIPPGPDSFYDADVGHIRIEPDRLWLRVWVLSPLQVVFEIGPENVLDHLVAVAEVQLADRDRHQRGVRAAPAGVAVRTVGGQTGFRRGRRRHAEPLETVAASLPSPEHQAYASELQRVLEGAIDTLPDAYRVVFMLRDVEGMNTSETGAALALGDEAVKTRLHRARVMLRRAIAARFGAAAEQAFQFHAPRSCTALPTPTQRFPTPLTASRIHGSERAVGVLTTVLD
jgi:RNA polymerase sigma factor (sigma-70 family)